VEQHTYLTREKCPSCEHGDSQLFLDVPDFRYSSDVFPIHSCKSCGLHYTKRLPAASEIGAFYKSESYDSHRLDNNSLISRIYRFVRRINIRNKVSWVRRYVKSGTVADYGCGLGHFLGALIEAGYQAKGFEIDEEVRILAKSELGLSIEPLESFAHLSDASVDVITMWHVLEHVYDLKKDFEVVVSKIKSGGTLMIAVPNFQSYDGQYYAKYWEAYDVPRHLYHFDEKSLVHFVEPFGLRLLESIPMKFDAYYVSMRSEVNKAKGSKLKGAYIGFLSNLYAKKNGYSSNVFVFRKT